MSDTIDYEQAFTNPDAWQKSLEPEKQDALKSMLRFSQNPSEDLNKFLSVTYVAEQTGQDVKEISQNFGAYYRDAYALSPQGLALETPVKSDGDFYSALKTKVVKDANIVRQSKTAAETAYASALAGKGLMDSLSEWQEIGRAHV